MAQIVDWKQLIIPVPSPSDKYLCFVGWCINVCLKFSFLRWGGGCERGMKCWYGATSWESCPNHSPSFAHIPWSPCPQDSPNWPLPAWQQSTPSFLTVWQAPYSVGLSASDGAKTTKASNRTFEAVSCKLTSYPYITRLLNKGYSSSLSLLAVSPILFCSF